MTQVYLKFLYIWSRSWFRKFRETLMLTFVLHITIDRTRWRPRTTTKRKMAATSHVQHNDIPAAFHTVGALYYSGALFYQARMRARLTSGQITLCLSIGLDFVTIYCSTSPSEIWNFARRRSTKLSSWTRHAPKKYSCHFLHKPRAEMILQLYATTRRMAAKYYHFLKAQVDVDQSSNWAV